MAFELAPEGIIVNAVSPGPIATDYYKAWLDREPQLLKQRLEAIPAGRLGTEAEIAEVIAFLATTSATFIQGHNLVVDGGFVIHWVLRLARPAQRHTRRLRMKYFSCDARLQTRAGRSRPGCHHRLETPAWRCFSGDGWRKAFRRRRFFRA
jgi:hypothetical protein